VDRSSAKLSGTINQETGEAGVSLNRDMVYRPGLLPIAFLLAAGSAFGQIGFPGQDRTPTFSRTSTKNPVSTVNGILRRISDDDMIVQTDDKVIMTIVLGITTKYYKASGGMMKPADLQPGDHLSVDASQDDKGRYHAKNVNQIKVGTPAERAAASQPVETSPTAGAPVADRAAAAPVVAAPPDPTDPGPPALKRGVPPRRATSPDPEPQLAADSRPSIHANEVNGVTRPPDAPKVDSNASGTSGDPEIDKAREAAFSFSETLPNFVVKQFTTRYQSEAAHGGQTSWRAMDTVTADVVSEAGKESYKNILIDGKAPKEAVEKSGTWSTGEYSSVLLDILSPGTRADFHNKRATTIVNRAAYRYDFSVEQPNSHWHVYSTSDSYVPEYTGVMWIDKENSRVLRIELAARNMPRTFQLDTVESAVDYDFVLIGDSKFLLPVHSEALSCERGTSYCSRNVIDFRNYKKFSADTSITFEPGADK
jgi:hypothetical protein